MAVSLGVNKKSLNISRETERLRFILNEMSNSRPRQRAYASKAGFCPTANWFSGNTENSSLISGTMKLYQGIGNGVEEEIVKAFERNGALLGTQVKLPIESIGGFIDLIGLNVDGEPSLYEIKTCTTLPTKIKPEHAAQVAAYWLFSGFERCYVIYVSRKVQEYPDPTPLIKVLEFDPTQYQNEMLNVFRTLETYSADKPPQRPPEFRQNSHCTFCQYNSICWSKDIEDFLTNAQMVKVDHNAEKALEKVKKERKNFVQLTLENCKTSVGANLDMLEKLIVAAKRESRK